MAHQSELVCNQDQTALELLMSAIDPPHYKELTPEPIDVIEGWGLGYHLGQVVKYLARAGRKGGPEKRLEDLRKARWYLDRVIGDNRNGSL